jgi:predicted DNA-binding WGR domain protein
LTKWLREFCVTQWCFVVLWDEFATDIPRAWLLRINYLQSSKFPTFWPLRASNQVVGGSTTRRFGRVGHRSGATVVQSEAKDEGPQAPKQSVRARQIKRLQISEARSSNQSDHSRPNVG